MHDAAEGERRVGGYVGQDVDTLDRSDDGPLRVLVDRPGQYLRFDPAAPRVAGLLSGRVVDAAGRQAAAALAIAVNGKVCATTRTYRSETRGSGGAWILTATRQRAPGRP